MSKIKYVAHPVTPEQKLKLRGQGFIIRDLKFAPEGYQDEPEKPKRRRKAKE